MAHLQREIDRLKRDILSLSALVEENLSKAFRAIELRDPMMARQVMATDMLIDEREVEVEEECLKMLALYQPVAGDLRFIAAMIKINSELERIGDLASNIAERATEVAAAAPISLPGTLPVMADRVQAILEKALDALVRQDAVTARRVLAADDEIDDLYRTLLGQLKDQLRADAGNMDAIVTLFSVARYLERLADHATNIAEDVLYLVEGEITRHALPDTVGELLRLDIWNGAASDESKAYTLRPAAGIQAQAGKAQGGPDSPYRVRAAATYGVRRGVAAVTVTVVRGDVALAA